MTVFDFDKTLTDQDTLFGFYREVNNSGFTFLLKRLVLICFALLYKGKVISNSQLKKVGVWLFLKNRTTKEIARAAESYAQKVLLNQIFFHDYLKTPKERRMIVSASLEEYLLAVIPDERIVGSTLTYQSDRVSGLKRNMYHVQKAKTLQSLGIHTISKLYTDSFSDSPLMDMAEQVLLVKNGKIVKEWNPE